MVEISAELGPMCLSEKDADVSRLNVKGLGSIKFLIFGQLIRIRKPYLRAV